MSINYLFPNHFKKIGWFVLIPFSILGIYIVFNEIEPTFLNFNMPAIFIDEFLKEPQLVGKVNNNILNEIVGVLVIISSLIVAFSKEKQEDELIAKIRLESLVWSVYVNYIVLLLALIFIYDFSFYWVMMFNMFTILIFFIVRFNWQLYKLNKTTAHEE